MVNQLHLESRVATESHNLPFLRHLEEVFLYVREDVHHLTKDSGFQSQDTNYVIQCNKCLSPSLLVDYVSLPDD